MLMLDIQRGFVDALRTDRGGETIFPRLGFWQDLHHQVIAGTKG
jgi:hypothetical protein